MIVLGIDTSTSQVSVALGTETETLGQDSAPGPRPAGGRDARPAAAPGLDGLSLGEVGGIAVGIGPGLFTGLRVGVQTAKTLAQALGVPIVQITSLDALATTQRFTNRLIAAVVDGRRGEVFSALYRPVPGGVLRITEPVVQTPEHLAAELHALADDVLAVGDGAILYRRRAPPRARRARVRLRGGGAPRRGGPGGAGGAEVRTGRTRSADGRRADVPEEERC